MSDENFTPEAAAPAPETGATATPEAENPGTPEAAEPKTFTQEELDRIVAKEKDKAERKARRDIQREAEAAQRPSTKEPPDPRNFSDVMSYADALAEHKAEQKLIERSQREQQHQTEDSYDERVSNAREKYEDFDQIAFKEPKDGGPAISPEMAEVIKESEMGAEIAYHLGKNPEESYRIYRLSPLAQARELGKIEASLVANPPVKKVSSAPDPITPVGSRSKNPTYDPTDARSTKSMSDDEWIKARNQQLKDRA